MISQKEVSEVHPFPLVRTGGLFVFLVGAGILLGAVLPEKYLFVPLIVGAVCAIIAQAVFGQRLTQTLGTPTRFQVIALVGSIALEMLALGFLGTVLEAMLGAGLTLRVLLLSVLVVVAVHFGPMALAEGPLLLVLGGLCLVNAVVGLRFTSVPLPIFWAMDGLLKIGVGIVMFRTHPTSVLPHSIVGGGKG